MTSAFAAFRKVPACRRFREKYVLFSLRANNPEIARHVAWGGTAFVLNRDWIEERNGNVSRPLMRASEIPCTIGGTAEFQVANVMACIAACCAAGVPMETTHRALTTFDNGVQNDGRLNIYECHNSLVVVDYAHNPEAIQAVSTMVRQWRPRRSTAVLGLPGDRSDALLAHSARVAARGFDSLIIREDQDRRGRRPGELAALIRSVILEEVPDRHVEVIEDELEAVNRSLEDTEPGEAILCFCDRTSEVTRLLLDKGAVLCENADRIRQLVERNSAQLPISA